MDTITCLNFVQESTHDGDEEYVGSEHESEASEDDDYIDDLPEDVIK